MFQYALALQISHKNNDADIFINGELHPFSKDKRQQSLYHFQLTKGTRISSRIHGYFMITKFLTSVISILGISSLLNIFLRKREKVAQNLDKLLTNGLYYTAEPYSMPKITITPGIKHIYAYCQTPNVIEGIENKLQDAFTIKTPPSRNNQSILSEISSSNSVCLHIRRGDYSLYPQFQICTEDFYRKAIRQAQEILDNPVFYLFSNTHEDIEWIKLHYHFDADIRYVDQDNPDYEELRLMAACKHFIISNSTFSWWAAILSREPEISKKVWAPSLWFNGGEKVKMTKDSWILL